MTPFELSRRRLLELALGAAIAWKARPWLLVPSSASAQVVPGDPTIVPTLEAFSDTLIPGEKRSPTDRPIAGAATGAGAVQAGAIDMMNYAPAGIAPALPGLVAGLNTRASQYAGQNGIVLDPTVPPLVSLDFSQRTDLLVQLLDGTDPDQLAYFALAALVFLAYHTAGHLDTVQAISEGHPGLAAIHFPAPNPDGRWRFPQSSYGLALAPRHPLSKRGSPH